jgi:hypothetical protein
MLSGILPPLMIAAIGSFVISLTIHGLLFDRKTHINTKYGFIKMAAIMINRMSRK